jgi:hypothetical protein
MDSFTSFTLQKLYRKIHKLGDRLAKMEPLGSFMRNLPWEEATRTTIHFAD